MTTLYLLTDDLRLADNPALAAAAEDTALAVACCIDESLLPVIDSAARAWGGSAGSFSENPCSI